MQKYVLVKLLERIDRGVEFSSSDWPLHVTLTPRFAVDWESTNLYEKLEALLRTKRPIEAVAGNDEFFGSQQQIQVTVLEKNDQLMSLHEGLIDLLESVQATFDEPQYIREGFRAHTTVQSDRRLKKGDHIVVDELTIVDMFPHNDIRLRKLLRTVRLSENSSNH